jgi:glycosyltransferase involved in cell wall biosynthesis
MKRSLNFLHLTTFYPPYSFGGDAMYIYRLAHALGDEGHHVDVIHCIDAYHLQHPAEPEIKFKEHPNVVRHGLHSRFGWLSPLLTHQTGRPYLKMGEIRKVLESMSYDVIHFHNISLLGPEIMNILPSQGRPIKMYTTHEHWLVCPMHVLWKFNQRACEKPECLKCVLLGKRPPQIWRYNGILERTSRQVDQFVSPSEFTAQMHAQRGFSQPVAHLPYFIERADADWQNPDPRPQERPYFLFVGRLEVIKGLQTLIPLWKQVPAYDLVVVGTGTQAQSLRNQAADNPNIKFLGALPQRKLGNLYYHALATIVPSITYETFGIIIIESFARKTPVIVRNLGALPEVVTESGGGFVYNREEELLSAINLIGSSQSSRDELGEKGYRAFIQRWSKEAHIGQYFDFLGNIAKKKFGEIPWE